MFSPMLARYDTRSVLRRVRTVRVFRKVSEDLTKSKKVEWTVGKSGGFPLANGLARTGGFGWKTSPNARALP